MAKHESTAINALIELTATQGPPVTDADDLMFAPPGRTRSVAAAMPVPLARTRAPHGTQPNPSVTAAPGSNADVVMTRPTVPSMPSIPVPRARPALPPPRSLASDALNLEIDVDLDDALEPALDDVLDDALEDELGEPVTARATALAPPTSAYPIEARADAPLFEVDAPWLDDGRVEAELAVLSTERTYVGQRHPRSSAAVWVKLVPWMVVMVLVGVFIGGVLVFTGKSNRAADAAEATIQPAVVMQPTSVEPADVTVIAAPAAMVTPTAATVARAARTFVDVRIDSRPSGATVSVIRRGQPFFLGTTPLRTALDPSRAHELELTHARGEPTRHTVDPSSTTHTTITLERRPTERVARTKVAAVSPTPAIATTTPTTTATATKTAVVASTPAAPATTIASDAPQAPTAPPSAATGEGVLMLASKPPCEIYVDGKATGLTTPQRALTLSAGTHRITLINVPQNVKKTFSVDIAVGKSTKVIQDLMSN